MDARHEKMLQVLSDPTHPDLRTHLRAAANLVTSANEAELPALLSSGLFTHLLHVLHSLPTLHLPPAHTTDACAAAAATLCNILLVADIHDAPLPPPTTATSLRAQLRSPALLAVVVECGMLGPAALQPMVPEVHMQIGLDYAAFSMARGVAVTLGAQFWTPMRICGHLMDTALMGLSAGAMAAQFGAALVQLATPKVFRHLLSTTLHIPGGAGTMPWVLMATSARCDGAAAARSMQPLMPELRQVLLIWQREFDTVRNRSLPEAAAADATRLLNVTMAVTEAGIGKHTSDAAGAFHVELLATSLDFALSLQQTMQQQHKEAAAPFGPLTDFVGGMMTACCERLATACEWGRGRAGMEELLLRKGLLLRWLVGLRMLPQPGVAHLLRLAARMLVPPPAAAAGGSSRQAAAFGPGNEGLPSQFLEGLLTEAYPALRWCIEADSPSPTLGSLAIILVYKAVVASSAYMAQHPREEVLDGIGQFLEEALPYGPSCMPVVAGGPGGSEAAASSHLDSLPARAILPILCSEACGDVLAPVAPLMSWMAELEATRRSSQQQSKQQAAERVDAVKHCILAIGDFIQAGNAQGHPDCVLWQAVALLTRHSMKGEQLGSLYAGVKAQHARLQAHGKGGSRLSVPARHRQRARPPLSPNAHAYLSTMAMQLLGRHEPSTWWDSAQELLPGFLACPDNTMRAAAEEAVLAGVAYATLATGLDDWPDEDRVRVARMIYRAADPMGARHADPTFNPTQGRLHQAYTFTKQGLWETEPAVMDLWLVGALLTLGGQDPWSDLGTQYVYRSRGWDRLKEWSLAYARGAVAGGGGATPARLEGRRALRFECAQVLAAAMAEGVNSDAPVPKAHKAFCWQWRAELDTAAGCAATPGREPSAASSRAPSAASSTAPSGASRRRAKGKPVGPVGAEGRSSAAAGMEPTGRSDASEPPESSAGGGPPVVPEGSLQSGAADADPAAAAAAGGPGAGAGASRAGAHKAEAAAVGRAAEPGPSSAPQGTDCEQETPAQSAPSPADDRQCGQCRGHHEVLQVCSGCSSIKYCSADCQRAHWKQHRKDCKRVQREQQAALLKAAAAANCE